MAKRLRSNLLALDMNTIGFLLCPSKYTTIGQTVRPKLDPYFQFWILKSLLISLTTVVDWWVWSSLSLSLSTNFTTPAIVVVGAANLFTGSIPPCVGVVIPTYKNLKMILSDIFHVLHMCSSSYCFWTLQDLSPHLGGECDPLPLYYLQWWWVWPTPPPYLSTNFTTLAIVVVGVASSSSSATSSPSSSSLCPCPRLPSLGCSGWA